LAELRECRSDILLLDPLHGWPTVQPLLLRQFRPLGLQLPFHFRDLVEDRVEAAGIVDPVESGRQPGNLSFPVGDLLLELPCGARPAIAAPRAAKSSAFMNRMVDPLLSARRRLPSSRSATPVP
jgi:hypothetical protein